MAASIDMGDGTVIPIRLPDTQGFTTGSLIGPEVAVNSPANTLILMPEHFLKSNGTIVGIDYIAASAGDISLQIYRPSCADPTLSFCHNSYSCMPSGESCMAQPRGIKWRHACGTTAIYNLARRKCVDRTTNQIIPDPITQNWASVEFHRYDLVKEIEFTIPNMGRHFFAVPDEELFTLTAGDVLAIHESSGRLKLLDATSKNYEFYWDISGDGNFASRSTSGYVISDSSAPSVLAAQHALQVYYTRPVRGKIRHTYAAATNLDHYNVTASVSNNVTIPAATVEKTINVQVPITGLDVLLPLYVPTNATIQFNVTDHVGSEPVYTWVYGDGEMNVTSSKSVEKTYTVAGVYTVTLSAQNEISSQTIERVIVIQDLILNFTVEMETMATVYTKPTTINFSILQGTNVSYSCNMGDGHVYTFDFPFSGYLSNDTDKIINSTNITETVYFMNGTSNGYDGFIQYIYDAPDWYNFSITAYNQVSNVTWDIYIPVQVPIEGLEIAATPTIPFGTNRNIPISLTAGSHTDIVITWNGTSLNESYFNWHTLYGEAVVQSNHYDSNGRFFVSANVTNLVSPYVTFTREVWVDYMITDLLIFLFRPFVPVGEKTTFDIYMSHCSRFDTFINFSDGSSLQHFYHDLLLNETYSAQHIFSFPGRYVVNLTISNDVDYYNDQYNIVVQYPVVNVESFIMPTTRLEPGMNAPAYLQMEFMGGVPLATNASYTISFDDGTTFLDDFIEIFPGTLSYSNKETTESSLLTLSLCDSSFNSSFPLNDTSLVAFLEQCNMTVTTAATVLDSNTTEPVSTTEATNLGGYFLIPITHYYTAIGTYNITINVTNLVSFMFFSFIVDVDEPIYNLQLLPNPVHLKTFSSSDLEVRMSWGSRAVCTWIIGDGTPPIEAPCDRHSVALQTQTFDTVGVYHPKIIANNTVSYEFNTSSVGPIYVQDPVVGFLVECTSLINGKCERDIDGPSYSVDVEFQLLFEKFNRKPTNASYIIDFGDGFVTSPAELSNSHETVDFTIKNGSFYNLVFDFSHTYTRGGNYSVKVIIWNLVSNETYEVFHDIYEKIEDLDMMIHSYDPDTLNKKIGGGPGRDYFALEREVLFEAKHSRGSHVTYDWTFGDGTPSVAFYYDKRASKKYNQDISYIVSLDASNIRNSMSIERRIYIQRGCFNISISVDEPRAKNSTFRYQVFPGSIGTDACYLLDFSDETSIPGQYQMFGDENQCGNVTEWSQYFENDNMTFTTVSSDDLYHKKTVSSPNNYNLTIDTMFMTEGLYDVTLQCQNLVSHKTAEFSTGVTSGPCWWPYVNLTAPNICEYPECDPVVSGLRNIKRSERLVVYSEVRINCTATDVSWYSWRVYKVDEVTQIEEEIFDLGETDTYSIACRYLQIEPRILDYGLYRFELNVSMHEEMGMFTLDSAYIKITSTPLQVRIAGGDFFTGKWGTFEPMIFDGMSEVFDPDVDPDDKSEMEFIWLCRRYCESWPQFDSNYDVPDPFTMVTDCASYVEESDRGCFRRDQVNHAGKIINATSGMLEIMTGELYEGEEVEIRLIVRKDGREAEDSALALILTGDPPEIYLTCVTNCDQKMNPTNRYSLKSSMRGWTRGVFFYYEWKMYGVPPRGNYFDRQEIPYSKWIDHASTGVTGPHMALIPTVQVLADNDYKGYYLSVKAWRWGTSESNFGFARIYFEINKKPKNKYAKITVEPKSGIAFETTFTVTASGFEDEEDGENFASYKFGFRRDVTDSITWFFESPKRTSEGRDTRFPDGLESRQFKLDIIVRAYDRNGAFTDKWKSVTVTPAQPSEVENILATATEAGGLVDKLLMASDLQVAPVADVIGKFLNEEADGTLSTEQIIETTTQMATEYNLTEAARVVLEQEIQTQQESKKDRRIATRTHFLEGFRRIKPPNVEAMQGTAAALSSLTKKEDELTEDAQTAAADIMEEYMVNLERQGTLSADDREEAATGLTEVLGNVMHACGYTAEKAELEATSLADSLVATNDSQLGVAGTTTTSAPLTEAELAKQQQVLLNRKEKAKATFERLEKSMNKMIGLLSKYKVVGEKKAVAESEKLNITLEKTETQLVNQNPNVYVGGMTSVLLPKSQTVFGEADNTTTWFVETEALRLPNNPFTWTNASAGSSSMKITSDVITLKFRNDTGDEVPVSNNPQKFDFFIDRSNYDTSVQSVRNITWPWNEPMIYHTILIQPESSFHVRVTQMFEESDIQDYVDYLDSQSGTVPSDNSTHGNATEIASFFMETEPVQFYVFIRANEPPTTTEYDFNCTLSKEFIEVVDMLSYMDAYSFENDTSSPRSLYMTDIPDLDTCLYSSEELQLNETTLFYIGIKHRTYSELHGSNSPAAAPVSTSNTATQTTTTTTQATTTPARKKRRKRWGWGRRRNRQNIGSVTTTVGPTRPPENLEEQLNHLLQQQENEEQQNSQKDKKKTNKKKIIPESAYKQAVYTIQIFSASCVWWDKNNDVWSTKGCEVGPLSKPYRVHCLCDHLTAFGAGFAVPMNTINLDDSAFSKLDENPVIFATMVSVMCAYVLMLIWARKRDLQDVIMAGSTPLPDNDPRDKYLYELTIFTGSRKNAGTTAKISFILTGDQQETPPRYLADEKRPVMQRSNCDGFVMAVPKCLGKLTHLRIWHDNMGSSPSWYFSRMQIQDLQTGDKYFFLCEQWLSVDEEDGLIDRMIPIAGKAELTSFNYLFWSKTKHNLADGHLWFSIFQRPARSNFTRVQRLTCCLALLFSTMVSSIAFYNVGTGSNPQEYKLGPVSFTMQGLYIGIVSGLMCFPINLIIVCLFRYAKPRPIKKKPKVFPNKEKREDGTEEGSKSLTDLKRSKSALSLPRQKSDVNIDFVEDELEQQRDYLDTGDTKKKIMSEVPPTKQTEFPHNAQLVSFEKDGRKSRGKLPWWIIYVAYVLSLITVGVAFWASVEFGGVFGMQKSLDWLLSFFVSFFESIFFSQPIKVIVLAIFYALVIKKPEANEDEAQLPTQITNDEELLHKPLTEKDLEDPQVLKMLENLKAQAPLPPEMDFLETVRKERAKELAMFGMLKEIAICVVFINFILTIAYTNRDPWSYKMYANYDNIFNKAKFSTNYSMTFHDIKSRGHFWNWTENALLEGLYGSTMYNGDASPETRLTQDMQAFLIGGARLRQLRIIPDLCYSPLNYFTVECMREYSMGDEQRDTYGIQWVTVNNSDPLFGAHPFFTYQYGSTLNGYPYWGIFATYSGGGYVAELGTTYDSAAEVVQFLKNNFWIDKYTRAVFIEANLYNPNMNLWGISMYLCEFLQQGAVEPFPRFHIFRLDRYVQGDFMYFVLSVEIISIAFVIFYTVKEVRKIQSQGPKYFKEFWNLYEVFTIAIAYAIILVFIYRAAISAQMMKKIKDDPNSFTNFYFAILWDDLSGWFIGILTFLLTVRFLHLLRFNKKIALLGNTLYYTARPLLSFLFVFMLALLAFACLAYLFFNATLYDFRSYMVTIQTLLSMMLGKFDYNNAMRSKAGPFIFGFFSLCFSFVLINFFLTILIDGFESVRQDPENQTNEHEVVDYLMKKLKLMMGIGGPPKKRMPQFVQDPRLSKYVYIEGKTPDQEKIGELDDKVDTMLQKMEGMIDKPEDEDELEKEIEKVKNRRKRKIVGSQ